MSSYQIPVRPLCEAQPTNQMKPQTQPVNCQSNTSFNNGYYSWGIYIIIFLIVAILTWVIIYAIRPSYYLVEVNGVNTEQLNGAKVLLTSIIVGLIVILLVWLFRTRY